MKHVFGLALALSVAACATADGTSQPAERRPAPETAAPQTPGQERVLPPEQAAIAADFGKRVKAYLDLHNRLQSTLSPRPKETTPEVIQQHQRALAEGIQRERRDAKPGDIFTPEIRGLIRGLLARVLTGPDGRQVKASIMDENPGKVNLSVNGRYPDGVPLSTVPPQVLAALPKLPAELEYRFIGDRLILFDAQAHIVVDFMDRALPA